MTRTFIAFALIMLLLMSCEQKPTLQKYYVEKAGSKNFSTIDIAPSIINTDSLSLSADEQTALKSLHKLNVLVFKATPDNQKEYEKEKVKVKELLKEDKYDELIKFNSGGMGASISTKGEGEHIEEFVVYVHNPTSGFGVVRVLGDDMTPNNVLTIAGLLQKANIDMEQLKPLQELMKQH
jgi:hypothetical protein